MSTTSTPPANWRDVADRLTPYQVNLLTERERLLVEIDNRPADEIAAFLLTDALANIRNNELDVARFGDVHAPAGARFLWHWDPAENGGYERAFEADEWTLGRIAVGVHGSQRPDGSVTAWLHISGVGGGQELDADQARWLGDALVKAAAVIDRLNGETPPFM